MKKIRIGYGYDVHRFSPNLALYIGGVNIPYYKGFEAHSDGDILLHAICDALLGAAALGDIGTHFPDDDEQFLNADSKGLLAKCVAAVQEKGYVVGNVDAVVCLEDPKIKKYVPEMQQHLSVILDCDPDDISIKATTGEEMGFVGESKGAEASAVVLLFHKSIAHSF